MGKNSVVLIFLSICYNEALRVLIGRLSRSQWVLKLIEISKRVITGSCCKCWLNKYFLTIPIFMDKKNYWLELPNYSLKIVHFFSIYFSSLCSQQQLAGWSFHFCWPKSRPKVLPTNETRADERWKRKKRCDEMMIYNSS